MRKIIILFFITLFVFSLIPEDKSPSIAKVKDKTLLFRNTTPLELFHRSIRALAKIKDLSILKKDPKRLQAFAILKYLGNENEIAYSLGFKIYSKGTTSYLNIQTRSYMIQERQKDFILEWFEENLENQDPMKISQIK